MFRFSIVPCLHLKFANYRIPKKNNSNISFAIASIPKYGNLFQGLMNTAWTGKYCNDLFCNVFLASCITYEYFRLNDFPDWFVFQYSQITLFRAQYLRLVYNE
jgi:hypothetical protein